MQLTQGQSLSEVMELRLANRQIKQTEPALAKVWQDAVSLVYVMAMAPLHDSSLAPCLSLPRSARDCVRWT